MLSLSTLLMTNNLRKLRQLNFRKPKSSWLATISSSALKGHPNYVHVCIPLSFEAKLCINKKKKKCRRISQHRSTSKKRQVTLSCILQSKSRHVRVKFLSSPLCKQVFNCLFISIYCIMISFVRNRVASFPIQAINLRNLLSNPANYYPSLQ